MNTNEIHQSKSLKIRANYQNKVRIVTSTTDLLKFFNFSVSQAEIKNPPFILSDILLEIAHKHDPKASIKVLSA